MPSVLLLFSVPVALASLFTPNSSLEVKAFFLCIVSSAGFWLCCTTFVFHVFNANPDLWVFFGRPKADAGPTPEDFRFLFVVPPESLKSSFKLALHQNLCRLLFIAMLCSFSVAVWPEIRSFRA